MGGSSNITTGTKYSDLDITSSSFNVPLAIVIGTHKVSGNVIDYIDFKRVTKNTSSGKGGSVTSTSYTYYVAVATALCEGEIGGIGRLWDSGTAYRKNSINSNYGFDGTTLAAINALYFDSDKNALESETDLAVFYGSKTQNPWSYMTSKHVDHALNYPYTAYVAAYLDLGSDNTLPSYAFEMLGKHIYGGGNLDAEPYHIINDLLNDNIFGIGYGSDYIYDMTNYRNYCLAMGIFLSLSLDGSQNSVSDELTDVMMATNSQHVMSQGKSKFIPYGTTAVTANGATYSPDMDAIFSLTDDDYLDDKEPVKENEDDDSDIYNFQSLAFKNRASEYADDVVYYEDLVSIKQIGLKKADSVSLDCICTSTVAGVVVQAIGERTIDHRQQYTINKIPYFPYVALEPMDLIDISDSETGLDKELVRIVDKEINDSDMTITLTVEEVGVAGTGIVEYAGQESIRASANTAITGGNVNTPVIFEPPSDLTTTGLETWIGLSGGNKWGGCNVWVSDNGDTYKQAGAFNSVSRQGILTADFSTASDSLQISLDDTDLQLSSGTSEDASNLRTLCWVDNECIAYTTATLTAIGCYTLTGLVRGAYGTTISAHSSGSQFVRLDGVLFKYDFESADIGKTIYLKFTSFNIYGAAEQEIVDVVEYRHVISRQLPPDASNIQFNENTYILKDGTALTDLTINFTGSVCTILDHYNIYYDENNSGQWTYSGAAVSSGYNIKSLKQAQSVKVKVTTVNKYTIESNGCISDSYVITGKSDPPPDITGLLLSQYPYNRAQITLSWDAIDQVTTPDLRGYEVRLGDSWNVATKLNLATIVDNTFTHTVGSNGNYVFLVKAIDNSGNYSANAVRGNITVSITPDAVTNLAAVQETQDVSKLKISWTASPGKDIAGYEIRYGDNWDTGTIITNGTSEVYYVWSIPASDTYNIMVKVRTVAGYYSIAKNVSVSVFIEAYDVTGFTATQSMIDRTKVTLSWDMPLVLDVAYYVIKNGVNWDSGTIIGQRVTGTFYNIIVNDETEKTFWIKAVTSAGHESLYPAEVQGIYNMNPSPVASIQMAQSTTDKSVLNIMWSGVTDGDLSGYQVKIGQTWDSADNLPLTQELYCTYQLSSTGNIKVMIKTINTAGYYSDETDASLYCVVEPLNVTGFVAYQNGETVELYWDKASESDVMSYEIREGANFSQGSLVSSGVTQTEYVASVDTERNYQYFIKAINSSGHYSLTAAQYTVSVSNLPVKNVIDTFDEIALQNGIATNVEFGASLINFSNLGGKFSDYPTTKFSDVGGRTVLKLQISNGVYPVSGTYLCQQIDISSIITANITANFISTVILRGTGSAVLQIRTSQDGTIWTNWQDFKPVQYTFRYVQFKAILGTTDTSKTPEINQFSISIDVPDTNLRISSTVAVGGTTIPYGHTFYTVPYITATAIGEGLHSDVISKTTTTVTMKIKNESNVSVGGSTDIQIEGY